MPNCAGRAFVLLLAPAQTCPLAFAGEKQDETPPPTRAISFWMEEMNMAWTTPVIVEVCVGMEITSYESAEI